ncbi:hypothetical protein F4820DRAFT_36916 [Hypoxylon rubiginosum]|uniref:Uncharacterized protein n=1 Tax=Hypoxylon rubiginosum TaxID=110542 RepID=A0ACB9YSJ2_9PEZI|nr:hypothetical protein F4820DRAFT_36916 [Hypoxylon rubiginosum]
MLLPIIAALCCVVSAGWLRQLGGGDDGQLSWIARETAGTATEGAQIGWTPKPTSAPRAQPETERVLDLLLKRETAGNWTNSVTCGWMSGVSSSPWTCGENSTCATNEDHIVACVSGTLSEFYSVCLDYAAYLASSCDNDALGTGCCTSTAYGACATYLWTGEPARSMYRCASSSAIITMLDEPQFVLDASLSSQTATASSIGANTEDADYTDDLPTSTHISSPEQQIGKDDSPDNINRLAVIVACSVIGGLVGLCLFYRLVFVRCLRRRLIQDQEDSDLRDRLDAVFDPVSPVAISARAQPASGSASGPAPPRHTLYGLPGNHAYSAAPTEAATSSLSSPPTQQFPSYHEPSSFADSRNNLSPPEYSFLNPYPEAAPLAPPSSGPRDNPPADEDIELSLLVPRLQTSSGFGSNRVEASSTAATDAK